MPVPIFGRIRRFLNKSRSDQAGAIKATARQVYRVGIRKIQAHQARKLILGNLAAPRVLHSGSRLYVAYRPDADVDFDRYPELRALSESWVANNIENNAGDLPRLYALLLNMRHVMEEGIAGDFAEVGVYRGNSAAVLAHYGRQYQRSVFLFDTYSGFSTSDLTGFDAGKPVVFADTSLDLVQRTVGADSVRVREGIFPRQRHRGYRTTALRRRAPRLRPLRAHQGEPRVLLRPSVTGRAGDHTRLRESMLERNETRR